MVRDFLVYHVADADLCVDDKVEKVPKRRGPKPDSKPALSRRQALNRQAQRYVGPENHGTISAIVSSRIDQANSTHRERKEFYTKALEYQVQDLKETAQKAMNDKRAAELKQRQVDNENRLLRQLLQANNIPFVGSTAADTNPSLLAGNLPNLGKPPLQPTFTSYPDTTHMTNGFAPNPMVPPSTTMSSTPPTLRTMPSNPSPSIHSSISAGAPTPSYSPSEPSTIGLPLQPTNGYVNNPQLAYPAYDGLPTYDMNNAAASSSDISIYNGAPDRIMKFKDGNDPKFISFVVE